MKRILPVTFNTHNRTKCACYCLDNLLKNLIFDGDLYIYICDDRSENGHVQKLENVFKDNNFNNYKIITCNEEHYGYGYVLNEAIKDAYNYSDVFLTLEDDRLLKYKFDITNFVELLTNNTDNYVGIRLADSDGQFEKIEQLSKNLRIYKSIDHNYRCIYNLQCMLRHKKILDAIKFPENCSPKEIERSICREYNLLTDYGCNGKFKILMYHESKNDVYKPVFSHIGVSTLGHHSPVPSKNQYKFLFE